MLGQLGEVKYRRQHPVYGWTYTVHVRQKGAGLTICFNVAQEDIVKEMDLLAKFTVGASVQLEPFNSRRIVRRKWNFERGIMMYHVEGTRPDREWSMDEAELERRIRGTTEEAA